MLEEGGVIVGAGRGRSCWKREGGYLLEEGGGWLLEEGGVVVVEKERG